MKVKFDIKESIKFGLPIVALLIALASLSYTIYNNSLVRRLKFENDGSKNRPLLKFEKVEKFHYTLESNPISHDELLKQIDAGKVPNINLKLTVDPEIVVTNDGSSVATVIFNAVTDKYSGLPEMRKALLSENYEEFCTVKLLDEFYQTITLLPGKSIPFRYPHEIGNINFEKDEFTIHYLTIYTNEIGNVYDSYFWIRFKMRPIEGRVEGTDEKLNIILEKLEGSLKVIDTHFQTCMYTHDESKKILDIHERHRKKLMQ
jgi:hypothetical protein